MKYSYLLIMFAQALAAAPQGVLVVKGTDVAGIDKALSSRLDERKSAAEQFHTAGDYQSVLVHREADGEAELDEDDAVLLIVESGEATLVTGGKLVDPKTPTSSDVRAASLQGGDKTPLAEKDVVVIPADLAYQILVAAGKQVTYLVIRHKDANGSFEESNSPGVPAPPAAATAKKDLLGADLGLGFRACVPGDNSPDGTILDGYKKVISRNFTAHSCVWKSLQSAETSSDGAAGLHGKPQLGVDMGAGYRACLPADDSPNGTVVDGYRKISHTGPLGVSCGWVKIQ